MLNKKQIIVICICLVIVITILYGRSYIYKDLTISNSQTELEVEKHNANPQVMIIHYHERKPYYIEGANGVHGLCADPVKLAFMKAGISFRWQKTPANRQLKIIKENRAPEFAIGWFKNAERQKFAKFTSHIYRDKPTLALARSDNEIIKSEYSIDHVLSNRRLRLLRKAGYSYGAFIDEKITAFQPRQIETTSENINMLMMVKSHRADYFFVADEEAKELISQSGYQLTDFKYIRFTDMPEGNKRYLLCSQKVDDKIIVRLNRAIRHYVQKEDNP